MKDVFDDLEAENDFMKDLKYLALLWCGNQSDGDKRCKKAESFLTLCNPPRGFGEVPEAIGSNDKDMKDIFKRMCELATIFTI